VLGRSAEEFRANDIALLLYALAMVEHLPDSVVSHFRAEVRRPSRQSFTQASVNRLYQADLTAIALRNGGTVLHKDPVILDR
jgi:hypothetical protein